MILKWEGTYGYGDAINAVTNALWQSYQLDDVVNLEMQWHIDRSYYPPTQKYHPNDPETILERFDYILKSFKGHERINVSHHDRVFKYKDEKLRFKWYPRWHQGRPYSAQWDTIKDPIDNGYICLWEPSQNVDSVHRTFATSFKDPLSRDGTWDRLYKCLEGYEVRRISYRMPIDEVFETIRGARYCVGYEGIGQLIAKNFWKPMTTFIYTNDVGYRNVAKMTSGTWASKTESPLVDIEDEIKRQLPIINKEKRLFNNIKSMYHSIGYVDYDKH